MGFFDFFKGKKHEDPHFHSGSPEAQAHWAQYQRFKDAKSKVLGEALGQVEHFQNPGDQSGRIFNKRQATGRNGYAEKGFNVLAAELKAGQLAGLVDRDEDAFADVYENLSNMQKRLQNDHNAQSFDAKRKAIEAEFKARLPQPKALEAAEKFEALLTNDAEFKELADALKLNEARESYKPIIMGDAGRGANTEKSGIFKAARDAGNHLLEIRLGLKRDTLKDSILGDPGMLLSTQEYYGQTYEADYAEFKEGTNDQEFKGNGSHLEMIKISLHVASGREKVAPQHADKSLNEYFSARQQELQRPEAGAQREVSLDRDADTPTR